MWFVKGPSKFGVQLAALYAALFALSVVVLGIVSTALVEAALRAQIDQRIAAEMDELVALNAAAGGDALANAVTARMAKAPGLGYRLESAAGTRIAGNLAPTGHGLGWFNFGVDAASAEGDIADSFRGYAAGIGGGTLTIADDTDEIEDIGTALAGVFALAALLATALAVAGGFGLSKFYLRKLDRLGETAAAITGGALDQRMALTHSGDEFDRLSQSLNCMLDRNAQLLESQRQIVNDIAHDIRTPLTRLRQTLEAGMRGGNPAALEEALDEADGLLGTFTSLLRIAEIEEGARRANFARADLAAIARKVGDAYAAAFEDQGKVLAVGADQAAVVYGDPELLVQLLSNLVENALVHTPPGAHARIEARLTAGGAALTVSDDGAGIPEAEQQRIFRRFYRLEGSRNTPGNGLGLSLVKAIATLHGAQVSVVNGTLGLAISVVWTSPAAT